MTRLSLDNIAVPFTFQLRPKAIPGDFRPVWKISIILLILYFSSRGQKASLGKVHLLNWALQSPKNQTEFRNVVNGKHNPSYITVRIEPSLNRAMELAHGEGYIQYVKGKNIQLTALGEKVVEEVIKAEVLDEEKKFLTEFGKFLITEEFVSKLFSEGY